MTVSFNLITEPWIPCLRQDGRLVSLGLRGVLLQAHELAEVHGESPLVNASLYRLLLALLHRVYGPEDMEAWEALWRAGRWEAQALDAYLEAWRDRFDLFHAQHPFLQRPDARVRAKSVASLLPHVASGNNPTLFSHHLEADALALTPGEAARALVTGLSFGLAGLSGIQQKFTDGACARGVLFFAAGDTLFETLALNLVQYPWSGEAGLDAGDRPAWEVDDPASPGRDRPLGYLDLLTWPNRHILLYPEEGPGGLMVRSMTMAPALRLDAAITDPMKYYRLDARRGPLVLRYREDRALWRDSAVLLRLGDDGTRPSRVLEWLANLVEEGILSPAERRRYLALGMANNQAKVEFYRQETLPLPLDYLARQELVEIVEESLALAEGVSTALGRAARALARFVLAPGADLGNGHDPKREDIDALCGQWAITRGYWSRLELPFRQLLEALPGDPDAHRIAWRQTLRELAWEAFDGVAAPLEATPRQMKAVVRGREALARGIGEALGSLTDAAMAPPHDMPEERRSG